MTNDTNSFISTETVTKGTPSLRELQIINNSIYWLERDPAVTPIPRIFCLKEKMEGWGEGQVKLISPPTFSVRTRLHEYGGGAFWGEGDTIYFCNDDDQRIYCQKENQPPVAMTPLPPTKHAWRYAAGVAMHGRVYAVRETHQNNTVQNEIVLIQPNQQPVVVASGRDFYGPITANPKRHELAFITWDHPNMPWSNSELWRATLNDEGLIQQSKCVAGGHQESIYGPCFFSDGALYFASDRTGYWNIYREQDGHIEALCPLDKDCGLPQWVFGTNTFTHCHDGSIAFIYLSEANYRIGIVDKNGAFKNYPITGTCVADNIHTYKTGFVIIAASKQTGFKIIYCDLKTQKEEILYQKKPALPQADIATAKSMWVKNRHQENVHAFYYPPTLIKTSNHAALPPLMVKCHGGPTAMADNALDLKKQFWTSRGFAYLDVNYGGSSGFGRLYRERLDGQWGILDVEDTIDVVKKLINEKKVDPQKICITGSSAGGYTTLCALTFHDFFSAGSSYYGVADCEMLAKDTHKFEAHYLDSLIGRYPEDVTVYQQRSPLFFLSKLNCPLIIFQGLEDYVVPPSQAEAMVKALQEKRIPYAYITFPDEAHGFRNPANIAYALEAEFDFYCQIFNLPYRGEVNITIHNFSKATSD